MKKIYPLLLLSLLPLIVVAKEPTWIKKRPLPDNNTYEYRCEEATGMTKEAAEQKAMAQVMYSTIRRIGMAINSADVQHAIDYGTSIQKISEDYRIPVNKVCSYTEKIEGGYRCYVLCQVAISGAIKPQWGTFNNCGATSAGKDMVEIDYPTEWKMYETEEYVASFQRERYDKGTKQTEAIASLKELAERDLRSRLGIEEGNTTFNMYTDSKVKYLPDARSDGEYAFVVMFISRNQLIKYYNKAAEHYTNEVYSSIDEARTFADSGEKGEAELLLQTAQQQLNEAVRNTNRLYAYGEDIAALKENHKECQIIISDLLKKVGDSTGKGKRDKINNYIEIALDAQMDERISEALMFYHWANVLLNSMPASEQKDILYTDRYDNERQVVTWLPKQISSLLKAITFSYAGESPEDPEMGMVNVLYQNKPVKSLDYRYYTNLGWSQLYRAKDGTGVIRFYKNKDEEPKLLLKVEYVFAEETNLDREIAVLQEKENANYSYAKDATKRLDITKNTAPVEEGSNFPIQLTTNAQHTTTEVKEGKYAGVSLATVLTEQEARPYRVMIDNICEALRTRKPNTVTSYFAGQGRKLFTHLTQSGRITVLDKKHIDFYRLGNNVVARAVKMSFDYESNHKTFVEDVVFEFDGNKKIENLRYMLERGTMDSIAAQKDWSEAAKLAMIDFLENYKSSYALRDTTYLQRVFDNNAIIITGRVIKPFGDTPALNFKDHEHIVYTRHTKQSFLAALSKTFKNNSFVNIAFSDLYITRATQFDNKNMYGLRLKQTFSSTNYGDQGYLFLLMDLTNYESPIIYVRTWQPKPDMEKLSGNGLFGVRDFK